MLFEAFFEAIFILYAASSAILVFIKGSPFNFELNQAYFLLF